MARFGRTDLSALAAGQARDGGKGPDLGRLLQALLARLANPVSQVATHLRGLRELPPELVRINMVRFEASIASDGTVTQPSSIRLHPEYNSEIFAMMLYEQEPGDGHNQAPLVTFNTKEDGRGFNLFDSDWSCGIIPLEGVTPVIVWPRGLYRVSKGATLSTSFAAASGYGTSGTKRWGVQYLLNQYRDEG